MSSLSDGLALCTWVGDLGLSAADKHFLVSDKCLTATHISAATKLLQIQFPSQNGLRDTHQLLLKQQWDSIPSKFVQVIYVDPGHWACLSNTFAQEEDVVDLYDSALTSPSEDGSISKQARTILQSLHLTSIRINLINVRLQFGGTDCGLFAIAMAMDLCSGTDPFGVSYSQDMMRGHLEKSFEEQRLTPFDRQLREGERKRILHTTCVQVDSALDKNAKAKAGIDGMLVHYNNFSTVAHVSSALFLCSLQLPPQCLYVAQVEGDLHSTPKLELIRLEVGGQL